MIDDTGLTEDELWSRSKLSDVTIVAPQKKIRCATCREKHPISQYNNGGEVLSPKCVACRWSERAKKYGVATETLLQMLKEQDFCCKICSTSFPDDELHATLHVDHDHNTGIVRGLLCHRCNTLLGRVGDDARILRSAAKYLDNVSHCGGDCGTLPNDGDWCHAWSGNELLLVQADSEYLVTDAGILTRNALRLAIVAMLNYEWGRNHKEDVGLIPGGDTVSWGNGGNSMSCLFVPGFTPATESPDSYDISYCSWIPK